MVVVIMATANLNELDTKPVPSHFRKARVNPIRP